MTFQSQHCMDKVGFLLYLKFMKECYPDEKVGLIWDAVTSHICDEVIARAESLGIVLGFIPPGCTSLIQVCDLIANKPIKHAFKKSYVSFKLKNYLGPGGKYKISRDDIIL